VLAFLQAVTARQADLVARWLLVGFIHGVMNTDNCSIAGETIDYGPCAFLDEYDPAKVFSSIDQFGRYAYGNQPGIAQWNLARLAETLLGQIGGEREAVLEQAKDVLVGFAPRFQAAWFGGLARKIGLRGGEADAALGEDLLNRMAENAVDFTLAFRRLSDAAADPAGDAAVRALFADPAAYDGWAAAWRARCAEDGVAPAARAAAMRAVNPAYIPRNHLVEEAIGAAAERHDLAPFAALSEVLAHPFEDQPGRERYAAPPEPDERVLRTFCGT
jgi:uncharacterized protein YdiU (UPF0061 family)